MGDTIESKLNAMIVIQFVSSLDKKKKILKQKYFWKCTSDSDLKQEFHILKGLAHRTVFHFNLDFIQFWVGNVFEVFESMQSFLLQIHACF